MYFMTMYSAVRMPLVWNCAIKIRFIIIIIIILILCVGRIHCVPCHKCFAFFGVGGKAERLILWMTSKGKFQYVFC